MSTPCPCLLMTLLDECYYEESPCHPVVCRLWRMRPKVAEGRVHFAIGMESPTRRYLYRVGESESSARRLFASMVEGRLSPVHLREVVEDLRWEAGQMGESRREIVQAPLQIPESMV